VHALPERPSIYGVRPGHFITAAKPLFMAEIVPKKKLMVEIRPFPLERGAKRDPDNVFLKKRSG
jgi:hypothetical protein